MIGKIINWNVDGGFGKIQSDELKEDLFFHISGFIRKIENHEISAGMKLEFELGETSRGPRAITIKFFSEVDKL